MSNHHISIISNQHMDMSYNHSKLVQPTSVCGSTKDIKWMKLDSTDVIKPLVTCELTTVVLLRYNSDK